MTAYTDWLADPAPVSFAEWQRLRSVPDGLLNPQPVVVQRAERQVKAERQQKVRARSHGTPWGWRQHRKLGEEPCTACWEGKRAADRAWRAAHPKSKGPRKLVPCGTATAARRHRRRGETVCDPCRKAESAAARNDTKRKSQRDWVAAKRDAA